MKRSEWLEKSNQQEIIDRIKPSLTFPCVVKSANQGSSIGISILANADFDDFRKAINKSFFTYYLIADEWNNKSFDEKVEFVRTLTDIREGIGIPVKISSKIIFHPEELLSNLNQLFSEPEEGVLIESIDGESEILIEEFIEGKEFSCIVIENSNGSPVALPPTEIQKRKRIV